MMNKKGLALIWEKLIKIVLILAAGLLVMLFLGWFLGWLQNVDVPGLIG
jgi:hypothetical protein